MSPQTPYPAWRATAPAASKASRPRRLPIFLVGALLLLAACVSTPRFDEPASLEAQGRLTEALRIYEQMSATASAANRPLIEAQIVRVREKLARQTLASAASALGRGETLAEVEAALQKLTEGLSYDDARFSVATERTRLTARRDELARLRQLALAAAEQAAAKGRWSEALGQLAAAERIAAGGAEFAAKRQEWADKRDATLAASVRAALVAKNIPEARRLLDDAAKTGGAPSSALVAKLREEIETTRRAVFLEQQRELVAARRFYTAYKNLLSEDFPEAGALLSEVKTDGARHYLALARREREADAARLGFAYFAAVKAKELDPVGDDIFALHRELADDLEAFITIRVGVAGFESPAGMPGLGNQVSDALITYLIDHLPHGVRVIERAQTDQAMTGRAADPAAIGRVLDAEIVIVGNVSSLNIERKRSEREVTEIVQVGHQKMPNPLYQQMAARHGPNPAAWPYAVAPLIDGAPIMETVRYKMGEEVLSGVMVAYVRSFEAARGTVTQSREFTTAENIKDGFRDAVPMARITYDPLELPTDNEVRERLRARLVEQIAAEVLKRYAGREKRYLRDAEVALQRREADLAVLNLAAAHHYSTVAESDIADGRSSLDVKRIERLGLFELTE